MMKNNYKTLEQITKRFDINVSKIRYLEQVGAIGKLKRNSRGHRIFTYNDELEIYGVLKYQQAGVSIENIIQIRKMWYLNDHKKIQNILDDTKDEINNKINDMFETINYLEQKKLFHKRKELIMNLDKVGFGTWEITDANIIDDVIKEAIKVGYRHFDTAQIYNNEYQLGNTFKSSGINRSELFITSKVTFHNIANHAYESTKQSIQRLQCEYIDLMLLHAHINKTYDLQGYKQLMQAREEGLIKNIGVSNYSIEDIENIYNEFGEYPMINQIVVSPTTRIVDLETYCIERGIKLVGYSIIKPYYNPNPYYKQFELHEDERVELENIAKVYNTTVAAILNRWALQHNYHIIPKTQNVNRVKENLEYNFEIDDEHMEIIDNMNQLTSSSDYQEQVEGWQVGFGDEENMKNIMEQGLFFDTNY